jgi:DNA-binding NarL/FixJ family response regulator
VTVVVVTAACCTYQARGAMNFYVIDHQPLVAEALTRMLRNICPQSQVHVIERVRPWPAELSRLHEPDVIVLDPLVPGLPGVHAIDHLQTFYPHAVVIVFSTVANAPTEDDCLRAGAALFVRKDTRFNPLHQRLAKTLAAHFPEQARHLRLKPRLLTIRQMQLLFAIESGATNHEMADMLGLSPHTIKVHLWRMFQRFGVKSRLQLLRYAYDHGMV